MINEDTNRWPDKDFRKDILPFNEEGYIIHVVAANLRNYPDRKDPNYLIAVRKGGELADGFMVRKVEIQGPSELKEHKEAPLPGSDGRAVCYIETKGPLKILWDKVDPKPVKVSNNPC